MSDAFDLDPFNDDFDDEPEPPPEGRLGVPTREQIGAALVDDRKAKESCRDVNPRRVAGESLADRVYARRVSAPGSKRRAKLFARLGVGDPWDQDSKERAIALGPVGTRMEEKRDVAPHAVPKAPAGPKLPDAPRAPAAKASEAPKPSPQKPGTQQQKPGAQPHKPGGQPVKHTGPIDRTPPPPMPPPRGQQPIIKSHTPAAGRSVPKPALGAKPANPGGRPAPVIATPKPEEQKQGPGGRLRMSAQSVTNNGPRVMAIPKLEEKYDGPSEIDEDAPDVPPSPKGPTPPPEISRKPPSGDLGLDDLFGFAQNEGRMRIRRPKKGEEEPKGG